MSREALVATTLADLADTLVDDFDVVDLLTLLADRCVELFDFVAAGVMLISPRGDLRVVASSSAAVHIVEVFEEQSEDGPCPDCYRTGRPVAVEDLSQAGDRWPDFVPRALTAGFRSVHALPLRLRNTTIGALNLFRSNVSRLDETDILTAQAFADVATIAIIQQGATSEAQVIDEQLRHTIDSRVVVEQAKAAVAEQAGLDSEQAFVRLRDHARTHHLGLAAVGQAVVDGTLTADLLDP